MIKIQFGCGPCKLPGWQNLDIEVDMRKRLPFPNNHADLLFAEHCIEHLTCREALRFLQECQRILKPKGVIRVGVPCVEKLYRDGTQDAFNFLHLAGWSKPNRQAAVQSLILGYGHQSWWTEELLLVVLRVSGLQPDAVCKLGQSPRPELTGIDAQWPDGYPTPPVDPEKALCFREQETVYAEAVKP